MKKEFTGPDSTSGLFMLIMLGHLSDGLNSVFSAYENNNRRVRPPPDRGTLEIVSRLLIA